MADYLSRSPKFEAPLISKYDDQFVVKAIEKVDESMINTLVSILLDYEKSQLFHAHQETNNLHQQKFIFNVNLAKDNNQLPDRRRRATIFGTKILINKNIRIKAI